MILRLIRARGSVKLLPLVLIMLVAACDQSKPPTEPEAKRIASLTDTIPVEGGTMNVEGVGSLVFPAGSFNAARVVVVGMAQDPETQRDFAETTSAFQPGPRSKSEIRINTGAVAPGRTIDATLIAPDAFLSTLPSGHEPVVFIEIVQDGGEELLSGFIPFPSTFNPEAKTLRVQIPEWAFSGLGQENEDFVATLILGSVPVDQNGTGATAASHRSAIGSLSTKGTCQGSPIGSPLAGTPAVSRGVNLNTDPPHTGVDYDVPTGTDVLAAADGFIERVDFQQSDKTKIVNKIEIKAGYGWRVIVRHKDGTFSQYAHLDASTTKKGETLGLKVGTEVKEGQTIAKSNNSGGSTDPHLHFEYGKGKAFLDREFFDPGACNDELSKVRAAVPGMWEQKWVEKLHPAFPQTRRFALYADGTGQTIEYTGWRTDANGSEQYTAPADPRYNQVTWQVVRKDGRFHLVLTAIAYLFPGGPLDWPKMQITEQRAEWYYILTFTKG